MSFRDVRGQDDALTILSRALESDRVHHAYRFEGPSGVGKEMAAFRLAQALVCPKADPYACGKCGSCERAVELSDEPPSVPKHPDVVLVQKGLYSESVLGKAELTGIGIAQIRRIVLARARYSPHEGQALVFIMRDAHQISIGAANALLKTLEEPPPKIHFILLTDSPGRLLPTILSRTLAVRFRPLPDDVVADILVARGQDPAVAKLAQGSVSKALQLADGERSESRSTFLAEVRAAVTASDLGSALLALTPPKDRNSLRDQLESLAHSLCERARSTVDQAPEAALAAARRHAMVTEALNALDANAQPALALESLVSDLRRL